MQLKKTVDLTPNLIGSPDRFPHLCRNTHIDEGEFAGSTVVADFVERNAVPAFIPIEQRAGGPPSAKRWSTPKPMPAAALVTTAIRSWKGENLCHYSTREA
jgi:hypothetical protein